MGFYKLYRRHTHYTTWIQDILDVMYPSRVVARQQRYRQFVQQFAVMNAILASSGIGRGYYGR